MQPRREPGHGEPKLGNADVPESGAYDPERGQSATRPRPYHALILGKDKP